MFLFRGACFRRKWRTAMMTSRKDVKRENASLCASWFWQSSFCLVLAVTRGRCCLLPDGSSIQLPTRTFNFYTSTCNPSAYTKTSSTPYSIQTRYGILVCNIILGTCYLVYFKLLQHHSIAAIASRASEYDVVRCRSLQQARAFELRYNTPGL